MLKLNACLWIFLLALGGCRPPVPSGPDRSSYELKGPVKALEEVKYSAILQDGEVAKGPRQRRPDDVETDHAILFDRSGNVTASTDFRSDGQVLHRVVWKREPNLVIRREYGPRDILLGQTLYHYDRTGNVHKELELAAAGHVERRFARVFDESGNELEERLFAADGALDYLHTYRYDGRGNRTEKKEFSPEGVLRIKHLWRYNEAGDPVGYERYSSDDSLMIRQRFIYDALGNKVRFEEEFFYAEGVPFNRFHTWRWDTEQRMTEEMAHHADGRLKMARRWVYDNEGNTSERTDSYPSESGASTYLFTQDEWGNNVRITEIKNGVPASITERTISYYR